MISGNSPQMDHNDPQKIFVSTVLSLIILYLGLVYLLTLMPFRFSTFPRFISINICFFGRDICLP